MTDLAYLRHLMLQREAHTLGQLKSDMAVAPAAVFDLWMKQRSELVRPRTPDSNCCCRYLSALEIPLPLSLSVPSA